VRDDRDCGTIVDFVQNRERLTIGELRKALCLWIGEAANPPRRPLKESFAPEVEPITKDLARVRALFASMQPVETTHRYLEQERNIPAEVLADPIFAGRIYTDRYHNAVFPHYDHDGLCGFELHNTSFKGFARRARKGLWYSVSTPEDSTLVIAESAIEALSYHALHHPARTRYFSIAGETNPAQRLLITAACAKLPPGATFIIVTNNDDGGRHLAVQLRGLALAAGREDLAILDHAPEGEGADWNDVLREQCHPAPAYPSGAQSLRSGRQSP
jgi:hypothetical protein